MFASSLYEDYFSITAVSPGATSFISQLAQWDEAETTDRLRKRVDFSVRVVERLVIAIERLRAPYMHISDVLSF